MPSASDPRIAPFRALIEYQLKPVQVIYPGFRWISRRQMHVQLYGKAWAQHRARMLGQSGDFRSSVIPPSREVSG